MPEFGGITGRDDRGYRPKTHQERQKRDKRGISKEEARTLYTCKAMMDDPSPEVRTAAVGAFKGTRRNSAVECLRKRAFTLEEDPGVRDKLLAVLKSSPNDNAALVLCDAIPFWMRSYVIEDIPGKVPGAKIVKTQNDRDWERSYECFERAYRNSSGYSCFARMHVAAWFREVGGKPFVPECPGYKRTE